MCTDEILAVGRMKMLENQDLAENVKKQIEGRFPRFKGEVCQFQRILKNGEMIHSQQYQRVEQRNSYTIEPNDSKFAQIIMYHRLTGGCFCHKFFQFCSCSNKLLFSHFSFESAS